MARDVSSNQTLFFIGSRSLLSRLGPVQAGAIRLGSWAVGLALFLLAAWIPAEARAQSSTDGLVALYTFTEGGGSTVVDQVGGLDLTIEDPSAVTWLSGGGLSLDAATTVASAGPATALNTALRDSGELTVEVWMDPDGLDQGGPARLVTLSADSLNRNFTLGQGNSGNGPHHRYQVRLRTTGTDDNGTPHVMSAWGSAEDEIHQLVFSRSVDGTARLYVNGDEIHSGSFSGDLSPWDLGYRLALGNELTGGRPWLGDIYKVAIYDRALAAGEVAEAFNARQGIRPARTREGLQTLYTFQEGGGDVIADVSGSATPVNLTIADPSTVTWLPGGGLSLDSPSFISSAGGVSALSQAISSTDEVSLELWMRTDHLDQSGPSRIVSISQDTLTRNITLGQGHSSGSGYLDGRIRASGTSNNGTPSTSSSAGSVTEELAHVVLTRSAAGRTRLWINDEIAAQGWARGDLDNWDPTFRLLLGNEQTNDRPWLGELYLVALYDRELSSADVTRNYFSGPPAGPPPVQTSLRYLEIGPSPAILSEPGQTHQLTAQWVLPDGSRQAVDPSTPVVWSTSNPERVTVDQNGLATVHMSEGYSLVLATVQFGETYLPGIASIAAGAVLNPAIQELSESLVQNVSPIEGGSTARFAVTVDRTSATESLVAGDLVAFPGTVGIQVESAEVTPTTVVLHGSQLAVTEIFRDIDIDLDGEALQAVVDAYDSAFGEALWFRPTEKTLGFESGCDFSINFQFSPRAQFKLKTQNFAMVALDILLELDLGLIAPGARWSSTLECGLELRPRLPLGILPLWGVASIHINGYAKLGVELTWDVGEAEGVEVDSPTFSVSTGFLGGISYDEESGLTFPGAVEEPSQEAKPAIFLGQTEDYDVTWDAKVFLEVGGRLSLLPGVFPSDPFGTTDALEIVHLYGPVHQVSVSTGAEVPLLSLVGVDDVRFENPASTSTFSWDYFSTKEAALGESLEKFFDFFGLSTASIEFDPFNIFQVVHNLQPPELTVSEDPVFVNGGLYYPSNTALQVDARSDAWETFSYGTPTLEIWGRRANSEDPFSYKWPVETVYWVPQEADVGTWEFRAVKRMPLLGVLVSETLSVTVERASDIKLSP